MGHRRRFSVGRTAWQILGLLPRAFKKRLIRKLLPVPSEHDSPLVFKQAETYEEIEAALNLVYEGYVERGLVNPNGAQLRLTKYHALPTSPILIAKLGDEIVGTLTLILDSPLKLPLESLWSLDRFRQRFRRPAEVSSLAIKKSFRSRRGEILFPLCKYMYMYAKHYLGVDLLVAAVNPSVQEFYRSILLFTPIDHRVLNYSFARGAKAVGLYLPLDGSEDVLWGNEYPSDGAQAYYSYFLNSHTPNFHFPKREFGETGKIVLSPGLLEYLFRYCADILDQLTEDERLALSNLYQNPEYDKVIRATVPTPAWRQAPRFAVTHPCQISGGNQAPMIVGSLLDISRSGVRVHSYRWPPVAVGTTLTMNVQLSPRQTLRAQAQVVWNSTDQRTLGLKFVGRVPSKVGLIIDQLESELESMVRVPLPLAVWRRAG